MANLFGERIVNYKGSISLREMNGEDRAHKYFPNEKYEDFANKHFDELKEKIG
jgi:hypothetical protein